MEKSHSPNSERVECVRRKIVLLKKIQIEVLKKEKTLYEEWRDLTRNETETRR